MKNHLIFSSQYILIEPQHSSESFGQAEEVLLACLQFALKWSFWQLAVPQSNVFTCASMFCLPSVCSHECNKNVPAANWIHYTDHWGVGKAKRRAANKDSKEAWEPTNKDVKLADEGNADDKMWVFGSVVLAQLVLFSDSFLCITLIWLAMKTNALKTLNWRELCQLAKYFITLRSNSINFPSLVLRFRVS